MASKEALNYDVQRFLEQYGTTDSPAKDTIMLAIGILALRVLNG